MGVDFSCSDAASWIQQLEGYASHIQQLSKPKLNSLDLFYTETLPDLIKQRQPSPFITKDELSKVMEWKLSRGKWRPRLLNFVSSLDEKEVEAASRKSFSNLPDLKEAVTCLSSLKGVGPATASAVLAAASPDVAPFMSDEAMLAVLGSVKEYSLKQYLAFAEKLQTKAKELSGFKDEQLTPSDLERALWCAAMEKKFPTSSKEEHEVDKESDCPSAVNTKKRRKR